MRIAIIGSRNLCVNNIGEFLPQEFDEIVTGGAKGIDSCASEYTIKTGIKLTVFLPEYAKYGKGAPIVRNKQIVDYSDEVIAFWDGKSKGTKSVIDYCIKKRKKHRIVLYTEIQNGHGKGEV